MKQNFQKDKVVTGKTPISVVGSFCSYHSICLNMAVLYGNDAFSILVRSTKERYSSFLKKVFVF